MMRGAVLLVLMLAAMTAQAADTIVAPPPPLSTGGAPSPAIDACRQASPGSACRFERADGMIDGLCQAIGSLTVCVPRAPAPTTNAPREDDPLAPTSAALQACSNSAIGQACAFGEFSGVCVVGDDGVACVDLE